jgi:hypothetical protein
LEGLIFGAGFAIASVIIWSIGTAYVIPNVLESIVVSSPETPPFTNPIEAKTAEGQSSAQHREYSFFKYSEGRMKIPPQGGILAMATTSTPPGADRPNSYQIWLTENSLWQIKTTGEKAEIEKLPRSENANADDLDRLFREKLGGSSHKSMMTISPNQIESLKAAGEHGRDMGLNGKLSITVEGVVFVLPNPY